MKQISRKNAFAQGDVIFIPLGPGAIPPSATPVAREGGRVIVTHSETGHHHAIDAPDVTMFREPADPLVAYLSVGGDGAELVHHRAWDTHESIMLAPGAYQVRRQQEHAPEGWRRVED